LVKIQSDKLKL